MEGLDLADRPLLLFTLAGKREKDREALESAKPPCTLPGIFFQVSFFLLTILVANGNLKYDS